MYDIEARQNEKTPNTSCLRLAEVETTRRAIIGRVEAIILVLWESQNGGVFGKGVSCRLRMIAETVMHLSNIGSSPVRSKND